MSSDFSRSISREKSLRRENPGSVDSEVLQITRRTSSDHDNRLIESAESKYIPSTNLPGNDKNRIPFGQSLKDQDSTSNTILDTDVTKQSECFPFTQQYQSNKDKDDFHQNQSNSSNQGYSVDHQKYHKSTPEDTLSQEYPLAEYPLLNQNNQARDSRWSEDRSSRSSEDRGACSRSSNDRGSRESSAESTDSDYIRYRLYIHYTCISISHCICIVLSI